MQRIISGFTRYLYLHGLTLPAERYYIHKPSTWALHCFMPRSLRLVHVCKALFHVITWDSFMQVYQPLSLLVGKACMAQGEGVPCCSMALAVKIYYPDRAHAVLSGHCNIYIYIYIYIYACDIITSFSSFNCLHIKMCNFQLFYRKQIYCTLRARQVNGP